MAKKIKKALKGLFGGGSDKAARNLMREQQAAIAAQRSRANAIEAGQRKVAGGDGGFLAFVDEELNRTLG